MRARPASLAASFSLASSSLSRALSAAIIRLGQRVSQIFLPDRGGRECRIVGDQPLFAGNVSASCASRRCNSSRRRRIRPASSSSCAPSDSAGAQPGSELRLVFTQFRQLEARDRLSLAASICACAFLGDEGSDLVQLAGRLGLRFLGLHPAGMEQDRLVPADFADSILNRLAWRAWRLSSRSGFRAARWTSSQALEDWFRPPSA